MNRVPGIIETYKEKALPFALMHFQFVEEEIKETLLLLHRIVKESIPEGMEYNYPEASIKSAAMTKLIEWLRFFCSDQQLLKDLGRLKGIRDELAHRGYVNFLSLEEDEEILLAAMSETAEAGNLAKDCINRLQQFRGKFENA